MRELPDAASVEAVSSALAQGARGAMSGTMTGSMTASMGQRRIAAELMERRVTINRLELEFSRLAAAFDAAYDPEVQGEDSAVAWMRMACHMTVGAAVNAVAIGAQEARLPRSVEALHEARIGFGHLALLARTAEAITTSPSATGAFDETRLLARAQVTPVSLFRRDCAHARHAADRIAFLAEQRDEVEWRRLTLSPGEAGGLTVHASLDQEGGALLRAALEPLARRRGPDDDRIRCRRLADALIEMCSHHHDNGLVPRRASQRSHLQVTSTLETLLDLAGAPGGEMEYGGVVSGVTVQRLACDATITRVLVNAASAVIDVGRSQRVVPGATRRALNVRDRGCRWPGCDRSPSWTAAHHLVHWARGGSTDLDNLVLLCHRHHWLVHEGGWQLVRRDGADLVTVPPIREYRC